MELHLDLLFLKLHHILFLDFLLDLLESKGFYVLEISVLRSISFLFFSLALLRGVVGNECWLRLRVIVGTMAPNVVFPVTFFTFDYLVICNDLRDIGT